MDDGVHVFSLDSSVWSEKLVVLNLEKNIFVCYERGIAMYDFLSLYHLVLASNVSQYGCQKSRILI